MIAQCYKKLKVDPITIPEPFLYFSLCIIWPLVEDLSVI